MRKIFLSVVFLAIINSFAFAQVKVGVGIATNLNFTNLTSHFSPFITSAIKIPIDIGNLRIEPFFGKTSAELKETLSGQSQITEMSQLVFGGSINFLFKRDDSQYFVGFGMAKSNYETITDFNKTDLSGWIFYPQIGGEYFFSEYFMLGIELNYTFTNLTGSNFSSYNGTKRELKFSLNGTNTFLTARYFIF